MTQLQLILILLLIVFLFKFTCFAKLLDNFDPSTLTSNWTKVASTDDNRIVQLSINDSEVWGLTDKNTLLKRSFTDDKWTIVEKPAKTIVNIFATNSTVYFVGSGGNVFKAPNSISKATEWKPTSFGDIKSVSANAIEIWGITSKNVINKCTLPCNSKDKIWQKYEDKEMNTIPEMTMLSVNNNRLLTISKTGDMYICYQASNNPQTLCDGKLVKIGSGFKAVAVNGDEIWAIGSDNSVKKASIPTQIPSNDITFTTVSMTGVTGKPLGLSLNKNYVWLVTDEAGNKNVYARTRLDTIPPKTETSQMAEPTKTTETVKVPETETSSESWWTTGKITAVAIVGFFVVVFLAIVGWNIWKGRKMTLEEQKQFAPIDIIHDPQLQRKTNVPLSPVTTSS